MMSDFRSVRYRTGVTPVNHGRGDGPRALAAGNGTGSVFIPVAFLMKRAGSSPYVVLGCVDAEDLSAVLVNVLCRMQP